MGKVASCGFLASNHFWRGRSSFSFPLSFLKKLGQPPASAISMAWVGLFGAVPGLARYTCPCPPGTLPGYKAVLVPLSVQSGSLASDSGSFHIVQPDDFRVIP